MSIGRILAIATGLELVGIAAVFALLGLLGFRSDHYDLWNNFAPIWLVVCLAGAVLGWVSLGPRRARTAMAVVAFLSSLVFAFPIGLELGQGALQAASRPAAPKTVFKVATFNASAESYLPSASAAVLTAADPDVILVQEPVQLLADARVLKAAYPYVVSCNAVSACELAIWSKRPILRSGHKDKRLGDAGLSDLEFLWAETTAPDGRPVTVATTHFIWQLQRGQKGQRALLDRYAAALPQTDLVLSGDLNLTPWTYAMRVQDRRLRPLSRRTRALFSWPAFVPRIFMPVSFPLVPIDHVYAGPAWKTVSVRRLPPAASDHYPVMVTLAR